MNAHGLIIQQCDPRVVKERLHPRIILQLFCSAEGEPGQDLFCNIVIAPAGVGAVFAFHAFQSGGDRLRVVQSIVVVVENVPGDADQIRLQGVDLFGHLFDIAVADVVSHVQVRDQHDLQVAGAAFLVDCDIVAGNFQSPGVDNAVKADRYDAQDDHSAADDKGFPGMKPGVVKMAAADEDQPDEISDHDGENDIKQGAEPVVAQMLEKPPEGWLADKKGDDQGTGNKQKKAGIKDAEPFLFEKRTAGVQPPEIPAQKI